MFYVVQGTKGYGEMDVILKYNDIPFPFKKKHTDKYTIPKLFQCSWLCTGLCKKIVLFRLKNWRLPTILRKEYNCKKYAS